MTIRDIFFGDHVKRGQEWIEIAKQLHEIKFTRKELEKKEKMIESYLKELSEKKSSQGGGFIFSCVARKGSVDYDSIPELKKIELELYRKDPIPVWKLMKA